MPRIKDMINGPEWRNEAEFYHREALRQRAYSAHLERALHSSRHMLQEQQERAREVNRRTAQHSFQQGYGAAVGQVRREMGLMNVGYQHGVGQGRREMGMMGAAYQYGHRAGQRDSHRQVNNRPARGPASSFSGAHSRTTAGLVSSRGHGGHTVHGGFHAPPSGRRAATPPRPTRQGSPPQRSHGHGHGGSRASVPQQRPSPPNHGWEVQTGRSEWQRPMPGRRQQ